MKRQKLIEFIAQEKIYAQQARECLAGYEKVKNEISVSYWTGVVSTYGNTIFRLEKLLKNEEL